MRLYSMQHSCRALIFIFAVFTGSLAFCNTQTLTISEGKRLEAAISLDAMNRLTVANDRIIHIFGEEGTFISQSDEQTGQVFIKPTVENGSRPLSLTLITENGITQDLTLNPKEGPATTLILKNLNVDSQKEIHSNFESRASVPGYEDSPKEWVKIMKQAVLGELPIYHKTSIPPRESPGYKTIFVKTYQAGPYLISVWTINATCQRTDLHERLFYRPGDLAICLQDRLLKNGKKTLLYVLTRT